MESTRHRYKKVKSIRVRKREFLENLRCKVKSLYTENQNLTKIYERRTVAECLLVLGNDNTDAQGKIREEALGTIEFPIEKTSCILNLEYLYSLFDPNEVEFNRELDEKMTLEFDDSTINVLQDTSQVDKDILRLVNYFYFYITNIIVVDVIAYTPNELDCEKS